MFKRSKNDQKKYILNGNLSAEWPVRPPFNNVAAIPDEVSASVISFCQRIVAKINAKKKNFPGSAENVQEKKTPPTVILVFVTDSTEGRLFELIFSNRVVFHRA